MRRIRRLTGFRAAALAAVLLVAQTAALIHAEAEASHPAGEACALCVGLATLGSANVSPSHDVVAVVQRDEPAHYTFAYRLPRRIERRLPRGPPLAS